VAPQPEFGSKRPLVLEGIGTFVDGAQVFRVDVAQPADAKLLLQRCAGIFKPGAIEPDAAFVAPETQISVGAASAMPLKSIGKSSAKSLPLRARLVRLACKVKRLAPACSAPRLHQEVSGWQAQEIGSMRPTWPRSASAFARHAVEFREL
jgi:hypothetical protein